MTPIAEVGGLNLYGYCGNNPISLIDLLGLCPWYDELKQWALRNRALSQDAVDNNLPPWLAAILGTADDLGTGILSVPSGIGHLGEATGTSGYVGDEPFFQPIANLGTGTGTWWGDPTLANSAGAFQDISTVATLGAPVAGAVENSFARAATAKTGLGDLTAAEVRAIQAAADETGESLTVVGSAARGTRRGVGTDLPIGKGTGTRSDIDYVINKPYPQFPSPLNDLDHILPRLPDVNPAHGVIRGPFNPFEGPGIHFEPGKSPVVLPGN
ncbi:MAG: hypothetical protein WDM76_09870 [Limisphaerales bacterium]